jgi:hypothetical protein
MEKSDHQIRLSIIRAWSLWIKEITERRYRGEIWYASDVTLMFNHIPGTFRQKWIVMADEADRVYSTLINHPVAKSGGKIANMDRRTRLSREETAWNERKGSFGRG